MNMNWSYRRFGWLLQVWDDINYLVDLSGPHANCDVVGTRGGFNVADITKEGFTIGGLRDYIRGERSDSGAVKQYIQDLLNPWITDRQFLPQVRINSIYI